MVVVSLVHKHSIADGIKLPQDDGIDIISVNSLSFKRYCDLAVVIGKPVTVVTDNDGSVEKNITERYKDYIENDLFTFLYEPNNSLQTIEPSIVAVNMKDGEPTDVFRDIISSKGSMKKKSLDEVLKYMSRHKTEWAMRVFESDKKINYPEYLEKAIQ